MYMSLSSISRVTVFHLILNPLLIPSRTSTALAPASAAATIPPFHNTHIHIHSQSPSRAFSVFQLQCPLSPPIYQQAKSYTAMNTGSSQNRHQQQQRQREDPATHTPENKEYLALPDASTAGFQSAELDISGGDSTVKLDHLGPLVVNQDGTLSRITNWGQMTEIERLNTLRVLGKRNKLRMEAVKAAGSGQEDQEK
ncbi:hypothetical protein EYZ11_003757 [Aspergillus tanneri]|uniref:Uncharacterized protein n=1 Tax=Aspergillus tanneri TaxID=1220188 RepID=A0A4S3JPK9_9EURO|nr:hypothetical protein EYZ11_003757 [Aspergillus tanneri]